MEILFNLQMFADDEVQVEEEAQEENIPDELAGVDAEVAREIMQEMAPEEEDIEEEPAAEPSADADSDKQTVDDVLDEPKQAIPYKRFKEVNEKVKTTTQENAQLKEQLAALQARLQQPAAPQQAQQHIQPAVPQRPQISVELATKVNDIAFSEALKMSGLTKEEVDVMEYADDSDAKTQMWKGALDLAKTRAWNAVDAEFRNMQVQQAQRQQLNQLVVNDYATFEQEQMKAEDFQNIRDYAVKEMYSSLTPLEQQTVAAAYQRVEAKACTPQDVFVIKEYFSKATNAYRSKNGAPVKGDPLKQKTDKLKQMDKHPRASQVSGSTATGIATTVDSLEQMLNEKNWDEIPEDIQQLLLNGGR